MDIEHQLNFFHIYHNVAKSLQLLFNANYYGECMTIIIYAKNV